LTLKAHLFSGLAAYQVALLIAGIMIEVNDYAFFILKQRRTI
jgi:hypothetical protein